MKIPQVTEKYLEQFGDHPLVKKVKNQTKEINKLSNDIIKIEGLLDTERKRCENLDRYIFNLKREIAELKSIKATEGITNYHYDSSNYVVLPPMNTKRLKHEPPEEK